MVTKSTKTATAKAPAKPSKPAPKPADKPATEKVTSRSAGYAKGEIGAGKPSKIVAEAAAKKAALDAAAAPKIDPDTIVSLAAPKSGPEGAKIAVGPIGDAKNSVVILRGAMDANLRKLAVIGGSLKAVRAYIAEHAPAAALAHGVSARVAPNAALAASQGRARVAKAERADAKAAPAASKMPAKAATKTAPAPKAPRVSDGTKRLSGQAYGGKVEPGMAITIVAAANPYKPGSKAHATFELFKKAKTVAKFRELVGATPDRFDAGYIRYAARDGFIKLA